MDIAVEDLITQPEPDDLSSATLPELRAVRDDHQRVENGISYARRIVQGRLDIVSVELERRGATGGDGDLMSRLPAALASHTRGPGMPRPPQDLEPPDWADGILAEVDRLLPPTQAARLGELDDRTLLEAAAGIGGLEQELSEARRDLHARIDRIQEELIGRYRQGASVDDLLT